jgi:hypothetical protein
MSAEEDLVVMGGVDWERIPWIWKTRRMAVSRERKVNDKAFIIFFFCMYYAFHFS